MYPIILAKASQRNCPVDPSATEYDDQQQYIKTFCVEHNLHEDSKVLLLVNLTL